MGSVERDFSKAVKHVENTIATRIGGQVEVRDRREVIIVPRSHIDIITEKAIDIIPPKILDVGITWGTWLYYQFGLGHGGKTDYARGSGLEWIQGWLQEEEISQCLAEGKTFLRASEWAPRLLHGFNFDNPIGVENIPDGPTYYAINHPEGLMHGNWYTFAVAYNVAKMKGIEHEPRWFHAEWSNDPLIEKTALRHIYTRGAQLMAAACNNLLFTRERESVMQIVSESQKELRNGGSIAMSIEAQENGEFYRVHRGLGRLYQAITGPDNFPITPVGVWRDGDNLNVSFGLPFYLKDHFGDNVMKLFDKTSNQKAAFRLGMEIAKRLPEEHQGYYRKYLP